MIYMTDQYQADAALWGNPLTHSRILWGNALIGALMSATSVREGFEPEAVISPDTVSWWWPDAAGSIRATLAVAADIDGIGIAAHTIGSSGVTLTAQGQVGGVWQDLHPPIPPGDDEPIMIAFPKVAITSLRIVLSGPAMIGVLYAGKMLEMMRAAYTDLPPLSLIRSTSYETNMSQAGQFMGRSVSRTSRPFQAAWSNLPEAWMREHFDPFARAAREAPFFIALRPAGYPTDVGYVLTSGDITPERMGVRDFLQVQINGEAHAGPLA